MIVCLYRDKEDSDSYKDGCLYLFMNDDDPYYIYDSFCCYRFGNVFGDFGADIDHDGITEIVFCVQGTGAGGMGDCQKFVVKYRGNEVERMELPSDLSERYDSGLKVEVEGDSESGEYRIHCPYLYERIVMETEESEEVVRDRGKNSKGYYALMMMEHEGRQLLAGYEYLYAGGIEDRVGNAVFVFDWDENGKAFVSEWYVEDGKGKIYVLSDEMQREIPGDREIFGEGETGEEVTAYDEFLRGKRRAVIADDIREVQYALIDCGNDGKKQLALRAYGVNIYGRNDRYSDFDRLTMVLDYKDGKFALIYAADTWWTERSYELCKDGYVYGAASDSAESYYFSVKYGL